MIDPSDPSVYGPIGVLAAIAITAVVKLYRDRERDRRTHVKQLLDERASFAKQLAEERAAYERLEERYITKAEKWMDKYQDFSKAVTAVVDAAMRRYRRDSGTHGRESE